MSCVAAVDDGSSNAEPIKLCELRIRGKDGMARAIYGMAIKRRVVIIRVFVKKTQKTPIDLSVNHDITRGRLEPSRRR